jgi:anti-sigma factor RsiW
MSPRSHESWKEQLPAYLLGALSPGEKADLEHHLGGCAECQAELRWLEPAKEKLVEQVQQVEPSGRLKMSLMAAVEEDLRKNPPEEMPVESLREPDPEPSTSGTAAAGGRVKKRSRFEWLDFGQLLRPATLGALAVVLFVGVITGYVVNRGDESQTVSQQVLPATATVGKADATLVTSGNSGTLKVTDLEDLEDGEVYQAWVQKGSSVEPTDSLFTPRRDGTATTSVPDLNGVDLVMVSAEPRGGSQQPTSAPIITIEIPG